LSGTARLSFMRPSTYRIDDHNYCDGCGSFLANCRLIAGGVHDRRQFCSFVCYDRWREGRAPDRRCSDEHATAHAD
jgi:hypothetical protein